MDNITNPAGQVRSVSHRGSRWARLWIAVVAAGVAAGTVRAQTTYGLSILAGQYNSTGPENGTGEEARFSSPNAVVSDGAGNLYVADRDNNAVRKIVVSTRAVSTIAAGLSRPRGVAFAANKLYVADSGNNVIRVIDLTQTPPAISILAGSVGPSGSGSTDAVVGTAARFNTPSGLAISGGNLYVADTGNQSIRKIVIATGAVSTLAGPNGLTPNDAGTQGLVEASLPASPFTARFSNPIGLAADNTNLYVADSGNNRIRRVVLASG
jgi:sugar lactone lactonase YvrE